MKNIENLISVHKKRSRRKNILQGLRKTLDIGSSIASTLLLVREKPRTLDYLSVGVALANVAVRVHDEVSKLNNTDPKSFYNPTIHYAIPYTLEKTIFKFATKQEQLLVHEKTSLNRGFLYEHQIFWIEQNGTSQNPFCKIEEKDDIIGSIGEFLWVHNGTNNLSLDKTGELVPSDESLDFQVVETSAMKELENRILSFKDYGVTRSYLLEGPPGTGKTSAAMHLIKKLKLKSVRTSLSQLYGDWQEQGNAVGNLDVLLSALKPDMIIVDDIDRCYMGEQQMLKLFETARKYCKIIMATCNNRNSMIGAMLRVGRFDDHIEIDRLDPEVVTDMLDKEDADLAERMSTWPIAYIQNYKIVKNVMGRDQARFEIDDMEERIYEIERKTKSEGAMKFRKPATVEAKVEEKPKAKKAKKAKAKSKKKAAKSATLKRIGKDKK